MGWAIAYDTHWKRDVGYGVPATCDHPDCAESIERGLSSVCGAAPFGGESGCGLFFCSQHHDCDQRCERCEMEQPPFKPSPDVEEWIYHKLTDESWSTWRAENPDEVRSLSDFLNANSIKSPEERCMDFLTAIAEVCARHRVTLTVDEDLDVWGRIEFTEHSNCPTGNSFISGIEDVADIIRNRFEELHGIPR
jgi:hypothetical protein